MLQKATLWRTSECRVGVRSMSCDNAYRNLREYPQSGKLGQIKKFWSELEFGEFLGTKSRLNLPLRGENVGRGWAEVTGSICCFRVQAMVLGS